MNRVFFHASKAHYSAGETVHGAVIATDWRRERELRDDEYRAVEDLLESMRPAKAPSRRSAYFAFSNLADAVVYAQAEASPLNPLENYTYYMVDIEDAYFAPFVLVHRAIKKLGSPEVLSAIAAEYWRAGPEWSFLEYLAPAITIRQLAPQCDEKELYGARWRHNKDAELAKRKWP